MIYLSRWWLCTSFFVFCPFLFLVFEVCCWLLLAACTISPLLFFSCLLVSLQFVLFFAGAEEIEREWTVFVFRVYVVRYLYGILQYRGILSVRAHM